MNPDGQQVPPSVDHAKRALMDFGRRADDEIRAEFERARTGVRHLAPVAAALAGVLGIGLGRFGLLRRGSARKGPTPAHASANGTVPAARSWIGVAISAIALAKQVLPVVAAIAGPRRAR